MITKTQYITIHKLDETTETISVVFICADNGHFERDGKHQGWLIQLGTADSADNYTEVNDGTHHTMPDIQDEEIWEEPDEDAEAEIEDYQEALTEMGVQINEEE